MAKGSKNQCDYTYTTVCQDKLKDEYAEDVPVVGIRHLQTFLYFALGFVAFGFRVCLSVGIVAMTDPTVSSNPDIPTYPDWKNRNVILSAFFWGYILPQVFAAYVAKKYGAKWFLIATMVIQSFLSFLTPFTAAHFGEIGMMVTRAMQGFCQGFMIPSCTHLLSQWVPPQERSRLGSFVFTSGKAGTVFTILVTGHIAASSYGWPMAFYFFGILGIIWCVFMVIFGFNTPSIDPRIGKAERRYIEENSGITENSAQHKTPWLKIFTSLPVWALFAAQTGNNFCFWTLLTQIPTYMNYVMNFDMKHNSLLSSIPYLTLWLLNFVFSSMSDLIINKGVVSRCRARKIFNSIGLLIPAAALVALGFTRSDEAVKVVALLIVAVGFNAACFSGFAINHMDLSPNHAGTLMGLLNGASQITGVIAPLIVQLFVSNVRDPLEWRYVFFLAAAVNITTSTIYDLFGSGEIQPWNTEDVEVDKEKQ